MKERSKLKMKYKMRENTTVNKNKIIELMDKLIVSSEQLIIIIKKKMIWVMNIKKR